jgi:hypothetical protein
VNETSAQKLVFPQKGHYSGKIEKLRNTVACGFIEKIGSIFASGRLKHLRLKPKEDCQC